MDFPIFWVIVASRRHITVKTGCVSGDLTVAYQGPSADSEIEFLGLKRRADGGHQLFARGFALRQ